MPIIRKIVRNDCAVCKREAYCYFGVAFNSFPALSRVISEDDGFTSCWKAENNYDAKRGRITLSDSFARDRLL